MGQLKAQRNLNQEEKQLHSKNFFLVNLQMIDLDPRPVRSTRYSKDKQTCFEKKDHLYTKYNKKIQTLIMTKRRKFKEVTQTFTDDDVECTSLPNTVINTEVTPIVEEEWVILETRWYQNILNSRFFSWLNQA